MNAKDIQEIIDYLPQLIIYIYPGAMTIYLYLFFAHRTIKEDKGMIVKSIAVSYIYITAMEYCLDLKKEIYKNIFLLFVSILVAYLFYRIVDSKVFTKILMKIYTAINDDPFGLLKSSEEKYTYLYVYPATDSELIFEGYLKEYETKKGEDSFIILSQYSIKTKKEDDWVKIKDYMDDDEEKMFIFLKDIKRAEKRNLSTVYKEKEDEKQKEKCKKCIEKMRLEKTN